MTIVLLLVLAISLTIITLWKPDLILAIMSSGAWATLLWYQVNNPLSGMPASSAGNNLLVLVLMVGIILPPIVTFMRINGNRKERRLKQYDDRRKEGDLSDVETITRGRSSDINDMNASEYKAYLHGKLNKGR